MFRWKDESMLLREGGGHLTICSLDIKAGQGKRRKLKNSSVDLHGFV